jgi:hypothetical protein
MTMVISESANAFAAAWAERRVVTRMRVEVEKEPHGIAKLVITLGFGLNEQKEEKEQEEALCQSSNILNSEETHSMFVRHSQLGSIGNPGYSSLSSLF